MAPAEVPAVPVPRPAVVLPATESGFDYAENGDLVDAWPADPVTPMGGYSLEDAQGYGAIVPAPAMSYAHLPTVGAPAEYVDARPVTYAAHVEPAVRPLSYADLTTLGEPIEYVDGRIAPALLSSYATLPTIGEAPEYLDGRPTGAAARSYA